ncbi:uncharacterized protein LOC119071575 isoform X1 [Bradysia coprophila]|uniref:uncharacterized protein LOC119071575 isoform X1 n=1 Tax=Bradysia coprophila TaxID=38358 RepID=UPI00187DD033|nr:uncharacterized protein LOC119071575 isoform X1 [Bradysia coprophila]
MAALNDLTIPIIFVLFAIGVQRSTGEHPELPDCKPNVCTYLDITCPADSSQREILPIFDQKSENLTQDPATNNQPTMVKSKRSIHFERHDPIQIVPGPYKQKRSINSDEQIDNKKAALIECCIQKLCICDTRCTQPSCRTGQTLVLEREGMPIPGSCCPVYKCVHFTRPAVSCYSSEKNKHYHHGDTWSEGDCTTCRCDDKGKKHCVVSVCKALFCEKQINIPGECCPMCDHTNSKFCAGQEQCEIICRYGYENDTTGCRKCKCATDRPTDKTNEDDGYNSNEMTFLCLGLVMVLIIFVVFVAIKYLRRNNQSYNIVRVPSGYN